MEKLMSETPSFWQMPTDLGNTVLTKRVQRFADAMQNANDLAEYEQCCFDFLAEYRCLHGTPRFNAAKGSKVEQRIFAYFSKLVTHHAPGLDIQETWDDSRGAATC